MTESGKPLAGESALVTGASRGIGRGIALRLAAEGALVAVHYANDATAATRTVDDIRKAGGTAFALQADISSVAQIHALFEALDEQLRRHAGSTGLDILVNNAGVLVPGFIEGYTEADFDRQVGTNLKGPFFVLQQALPRLRDGARVINISSGTARRANPGVIAYAAAKAALNYVSQAMAAELGPRGITVNALAPGLTQTDMVAAVADNPVVRRTLQNTALGRVGQVSDIASIAAFLASPGAGWITGEVIYVTGGELL
jgi:3-oxoacyl-[acyl-carrier protein] reductase